jgi:hypothetical protein
MGLFDTVICDYPLPLPSFSEEELKDILSAHEEGEWKGWSEVEWQTKDMENALDFYSIEDDGQIYLRGTNWVEEEGAVSAKEGELEKFEKTAEINFYQMFLGEKWDHWVEFKATIWKGEVKEMELVEYKKEDNFERIEIQKEIFQQVNGVKSRSGLYKIYRFIIHTPLHIIRLIMGFIVGLTLKIERWLT